MRSISLLWGITIEEYERVEATKIPVTKIPPGIDYLDVICRSLAWGLWTFDESISNKPKSRLVMGD